MTLELLKSHVIASKQYKAASKTLVDPGMGGFKMEMAIRRSHTRERVVSDSGRRMTVPCDRNGRVQLPIATRGVGTYIITVDRQIQAPNLVRRNPNGSHASRPYNFSDTGRCELRGFVRLVLCNKHAARDSDQLLLVARAARHAEAGRATVASQ
ncbi:hypothetical protein PG984_000192 [Apiospora sp. TS-2023a]